jgi:signal transduction histidine kinase
MTNERTHSFDTRLLILAPIGRDATLTSTVLAESAIECCRCSDMAELINQIELGAGAVLIAEEALLNDSGRFVAAITAQPAWSDLPVIILTRSNEDSPGRIFTLRSLGNITLLERPTRIVTLLSVVKTALRARERQYQVRNHLAQRKLEEESLKEADRRKDEFLATLAHELRNPLAPIRNAMHILRLTCHNDPTLERISDILERQVKHMVRLVDDLLEVSRITRNKIELRKEPVELAAVIQNAVETSSPLIDANQHQLALSLPSRPVLLDGDMVRLGQVFANLLNNAAKYTPPGGQIWLTARCIDREVIVSVRDTGSGIPTNLIPRIFEPFVQAEHGMGRTQGGLGIGLTLVKRFVEMHGGTVEVKSSVIGQGTEFVVRLPMTSHGHAGNTEAAGQSPALLLPRRILVVDDNRDAAESLATLLKLLGANLRIAYSGNEAMQAIRQFLPHVVLLDLGLPDMNGYEIARWVREQADLRDVRLIALTGWGQEDARSRSRDAGFDYHLVKPADVNVLESLLNSLAR